MNRCVTVLLTFMLSISLFVGCTENKITDTMNNTFSNNAVNTSNDNSTVPSSSTANSQTVDSSESNLQSSVSQNGEDDSFTINGKSISNFSIVRQHFNGSYLTFVEIDKLKGEIMRLAGAEVNIVDDMNTLPTDYEIIVGNCERDSVEKIVNYDEYHITISGTKVFLNGGSPYSTTIAVCEFAKLLNKGRITDADSLVGSYAITVDSYNKSEFYTLRWGDDFDGDAVDLTKWDVITEEHYGKGADGMSGQNGKQCLRVPEANVVMNGCLYQLQYYDDKSYYGGTIRSNNHMKFMGGYIEHSVITPDNPASWNTCWMSSAESNGLVNPEIDLNENFGKGDVTEANAHVWPTSAGTSEYGWKHRSFDQVRPDESRYRLPSADRAKHNLNTEFHTFGFLWTEDYIAFIGDGMIYCDLNLNEKGFEDYKLAFTTVAVKLIIAASPGVGSGPKDTSSPEHWENQKCDYVTDYIHIYQVDDGWCKLVTDY